VKQDSGENPQIPLISPESGENPQNSFGVKGVSETEFWGSGESPQILGKHFRGFSEIGLSRPLGGKIIIFTMKDINILIALSSTLRCGNP